MRHLFLASLVGVKAKSFHSLHSDEENKKSVPEAHLLDLTSHQESIQSAQSLCSRYIKKHNVPGLVVAVSVDGKTVWQEGFGERDIENRVKCDADTSMLTSSISKPMVSCMLMKMLQHNLVSLDMDVRNYVEELPLKSYDGEEVSITLRALLSHRSGIRHYKGDSVIRRPYKGVIESLKLFKDDKLLCAPGSEFNYSTFAYTLVSAAMERASGTDFVELMLRYFSSLQMDDTFPDDVEKIIYNRSRYYCIQKKEWLINAPFVNCSYKWAGGGFTSTVGDLLVFANCILDSYQNTDGEKTTLLPREMVQMMWKPLTVSEPTKTEKNEGKQRGYGLGWRVVQKPMNGGDGRYDTEVYHSGAGSGNSCILLMKMINDEDFFEKNDKSPQNSDTTVAETATDGGDDEDDDVVVVNSKKENMEKLHKDLACMKENGVDLVNVDGVAVAILTNLSDLSLLPLAKEVAESFSSNHPVVEKSL